MADCISIHLLKSYLSDNLSTDEAAQISRHLDKCSQCQNRVEQLSDATDLKSWQQAFSRQQKNKFSKAPPETLLNDLYSLAPQASPLPEDRAPPKSPMRGNSSRPLFFNSFHGNPQSTIEEGAVFGSYKLKRKIGQGGMGTVYEAVHLSLKRRVALKFLAPERALQPGFVERFQREIQTVGQLDHPHIVRASDAGEKNGTLYLVMEYVEGGSLTELVKRQGPLSTAHATDLVLQAAYGLHHAHQNSLVHRDIKPSNLLITAQGRVKVVDLGLARIQMQEPSSSSDSITSSSFVLGSAPFMAPEQAVDMSRTDERTDIYALGCTFCFLLTGSPPYSASSPVEHLLAHRQQPVPSLRKLCPEAPQLLAQIFERMLAKEPQRRYRNMQSLINDLQKCRQLLEEDHKAEKRNSHFYSEESTPLAHTTTERFPYPQDSVNELSSTFTAQTAHNRSNFPKLSAVAQRCSLFFQRRNRSKVTIAVVALFLVLLTPFLFWKSWSPHQQAGQMPLKKEPAQPPLPEKSVPLPLPERFSEHEPGRLAALPVSLSSPLTNLEFFSDGIRTAWATEKNIQIWDLAANEPLQKIELENSAITSCIPSPDGKRVFVGTDNGSLKLIDINTGLSEAPLEGHNSSVASLSPLPQGSHMFSTGWDGIVRFWDLENRRQSYAFLVDRSVVHSSAVSSDGRRILLGCNSNCLRLWTVDKGIEIQTLPHPQSVSYAAFGENKFRAISADTDNAVRLWDLETGEQLWKLQAEKMTTLASRGRILVIGYEDGRLQIWDLQNREQIATWKNPTPLQKMVLSPNGRILLTAENPNSSAGIHTWLVPQPD